MALVLNNEQVESLLTPEVCLEVLEEAYREIAEGNAINGPRVDVTLHREQLIEGNETPIAYSLKTLSGVTSKYGAIRFNTDLLYWPKIAGAVRRERIPGFSHRYNIARGLILLFDTRTAELVAILNDGYLQTMRVSATSALAAKYLARDDSKELGIIGTGRMAGPHAMCICRLRDIKRIKAYSPNPEHVQKYVKEMKSTLGVEVQSFDEPESVVRGSDIVMAITSSIDPVLKTEWIEPGMHIGCVRICELPVSLFKKCDTLMLHSHTQLKPEWYSAGPKDKMPASLFYDLAKGFPPGEATDIDWDKIADLPDLITGKAPARSSAQQITCFVNNIGLGIQFAAVAGKVYEIAREKGVGAEIPTEWSLEPIF